MPEPISINGPRPIGPPAAPRPAGGASRGGEDFAALMRRELEKVSAMQSEADEKLKQLLTGQTQNLTEVFTAARKAEVAFGLLMEIRNKLVDAYQELKNMRV